MKRHPDPIVHFFISNLALNRDLWPLITEGENIDDMSVEQRTYLHNKYERFCEVVTEAKIRNM